MAVQRDAIVGSLLGTAVGDAIGLPYEGLSPRRARRLFGPQVRPNLFRGRIMFSDDTEHACLTAQALISAGKDEALFAKRLGTGLRLWLLGAPAGIGFATLRAIGKLWCGISPSHSGVYSAGNGPAMRAPILGAAIDDPDDLARLVRASTRITHRDPKAEQGALAIALAARLARREPLVTPENYDRELARSLRGGEYDAAMTAIRRALESVAHGESTREFAAGHGLSRGVSGYMLHTVPVVVHAWLSHQRDYATAITEVVLCGGDTDTTASILGGIIGCSVGQEGIPGEWVSAIWEWPRTVAWLQILAEQLAEGRESGIPQRPERLPVYGVLPRNALFATLVLAHGFRRLGPPY